ncbi:TonB-dependent receptor plug domain-containing protein [[Pseudomonas] boreopolis]|uniref:TonB-dependent receptor plug domain-containing protein n=1 Tax=Xanthomonas boreopolis TaxID=86183 RepID=UPI003D9FF8C5
MKTSVLRNAISAALFATGVGIANFASAQAGKTGADTAIGEQQDDARLEDPDVPMRFPASAQRTASEATTLESITVTGTRIRGGTTPSPVTTVGIERIQEEGFADLGEVIRSLPQNFSGGQNPGVVGAVGGAGNQDLTGGSSLNLRGLGADASLTLLNGRRLAYDGFSQAVDISAIPVEAVERLEIIADGASAIYGSDAVGGVANVILRRDFDGVTVGTRQGGATDGGMATHEYTTTAGTTWASGGLIATFKNSASDPIHARQRRYTRHLVDPYTIYGGSDTRSGLASVHQSMGELAELRLDALRTDRDMTRYVSQAGSYYHYTPETSITLVSPSIEFFLSNDWSITLGGASGKDESIDERHLVSAAGSRLVTQTCYCNESRSYELGAEGPLFSLGGGQARLAIGVGSRKDEFLYRPNVSGTPYGGSERARSAYAELGLPLVSPSSGAMGLRRLEFSAAVRSEDYDSFGRVTTPKLGVLYDPNADFTFKASWGKSFKAPTLLQRHQDRTAYLWGASMVGASGMPADATVLMSYGGNADLQAERARTWTASLAFHPEALPGFEAEATWFDIDYTDRVVEPVNYLQALSNPVYAEFVDLAPTPGQVADLLAVYDSAFYNLSGVAFDPTKVVAIVRDQYVNAARQRIKGVDLSGSYRFELGRGQLTVRGSSSWLDSTQKTSTGQPEHALAGTLSNPARLNGRLGAVWASGGFTTSAFANHTSGVTSRLRAVPEKTASFTTVDATTSYTFGGRGGGVPAMTLELSVQNLLDRAPPLYAPAVATYVPYDATNYSAIGRFVSASLTAHW